MRLVVTREEYFEAAMRLLASGGFGDLKIGRLCKSIGVTSGSFYNYFGNWDGFVVELLEYWEAEQTARIVKMTNVHDDPFDRIATMKELATTVPHETEAAIRAWGNSNATVAEIQKRVDGERYEALRNLVLAVVPDKDRAEILAVMGITLLVGIQQWRTPVDPKEFHRLLDEYEAVIVTHSEAIGEH
ncbi:TetR/AcrR family transcriptional regulator [Amycolatopsis cynarae]|uniref:TetR/AcrR family transcriptional regulator n=1 Tax=Amycolatopsis cynarae TaxID=2995223 RepID=A0ABY7B6C9_9PSEU|nr:TetR/AcrR family transcriptional regulator [Amycolatopsis sp. HUAS 11-8]WAL67716.1 TetR/AcrR family transcriptional regulator [Amycolatopsis sp. HUAS 11-8]